MFKGPRVTAVACVLGATCLLARHALLVVTVCGNSMQPTFNDGDRLVAVRRGVWPFAWRAGDIIVFEIAFPRVPADPACLVKRVVDGHAPVEVQAIERRRFPKHAKTPPHILEVRGDNTSHGLPSDYHVPVNQVLAKILFRYGRRRTEVPEG